MTTHTSPIPDATTMCHRTGFTKSCRSCVVDQGCRLWKRVTLENDPNNTQPPVKPVDAYDCADSLIDLYLKDMLRRQLQTTHTVDKTTAAVDHLRKEVRESHDVSMVGAISHLNRQFQEIASHDQLSLPLPQRKLIEN